MQFTGIDDFDAQFKTFLNELAVDISNAEKIAMSDARDTLKRHVINDVYDAYPDPTSYKRRKESGGLSDVEANTTTIDPTGGNVNGNLSVYTALYYNPTGKHRIKSWSSGTDKPGVVNVDYNALISRIETKSPAYNWGQDLVPARPFWQEFIKEMIDDGELEKSIVWALEKKWGNVIADGNIKEDPGDRNYR